MKKFLVVLCMTVVWFATACNSSTSTQSENESEIEIIWGIGNEIPMAQETPLFNEAPVKMITSWFSKPEDLEWMRYYPERNTLSSLYGQGYAQQLIIWLADYPEYAISNEFQTDLAELIEIFKGNGPSYGPLYVVLFTEYETYSEDPEYFLQLRDAFHQSQNTIQQVYENAYVAIGFGGYGWSGIAHRDLKEWEVEVLESGDFAAVQAHHHVSNIDLMIAQIRNSIEQLGSYGKPVMLSHFRIWKREGEGGLSTNEAFQYFINEMHTEESMRALVEDGLFSWNFFWDDYINEEGNAYHMIRKVVRTYAAEETELTYYN